MPEINLPTQSVTDPRRVDLSAIEPSPRKRLVLRDAGPTQVLRDEEKRPFWLLRMWSPIRDGTGFGLSLLAHLVVATVLGFILLNEAVERENFGFEARLRDEADMRVDDTPSGTPFEIAVEETEQANLREALATNSPDGAVSVFEALRGGAGGSGDGPALQFFGSSVKGRSFVFIVDMSGSMQEGRRFIRAREELLRSIERLGDEQRFYVYFFNDETLPMLHPRPPEEMLIATRENKRKLRSWAARLRPDLGTNPLDALQKSLDLKPDVIFILTDGEVVDPEFLLRDITERNAVMKIPIHTIAFGSPEGANTLQQLAERNGGTYRFVK
jgi:hypothetical protein